eukprot:m.68114 g.68114  ORF g.68114 m.68114 type:complete len:253 (-) comp12752_c1_seq1:54-812(-)
MSAASFREFPLRQCVLGMLHRVESRLASTARQCPARGQTSLQSPRGTGPLLVATRDVSTLLVRLPVSAGANASSLCGRPQSRTFMDSSAGARTFTERKIIGYSQEQLYNVVADIGSYKQFLPWCIDSRVLHSTPAGCQAQLEIGFAALRERYVSNVTLHRPAYILASSQDNQIFKRLVNEWRFEPLNHPNGPATIVHVKVVFEFENFLHGMVASAAFDKVVRRMIAAFEQRAHVLYGPSSFQTSTIRQPSTA